MVELWHQDVDSNFDRANLAKSHKNEPRPMRVYPWNVFGTKSRPGKVPVLRLISHARPPVKAQRMALPLETTL